TPIEELSQQVGVHPISVYWLLKEGREKHGWRCIRDEQRQLEVGLMVLLLRFAGHQWPMQVQKGEALPSWAHSDGIIPINSAFFQQVHRITEEQFKRPFLNIEGDFQQSMDVPIDRWILTEFFERHTSCFRKRPLLWQIMSDSISQNRRKGSPAFCCFVYFHKVTVDLLPRVRSQYVGPQRAAWETELRTLEHSESLSSEQAGRKVDLSHGIDELKEFDA